MSHALIILGHGSRNPAATTQFHDLVAQLRAHREGPVYPAFMELAEPSLTDVVADAIADGADEVVVQPCFLFDGMHMRRDIPGMLTAFAAQHPGVVFRFGGPLGPDARIADILLERAAEATCLG